MIVKSMVRVEIHMSVSVRMNASGIVFVVRQRPTPASAAAKAASFLNLVDFRRLPGVEVEVEVDDDDDDGVYRRQGTKERERARRRETERDICWPCFNRTVEIRKKQLLPGTQFFLCIKYLYEKLIY